MNALARFIAKCAHDPYNNCVIWTGGTTAGRGNSARYGSFWFEGRRWYAHRWAAIYIHKLPVGDLTVGHCCPGGPRSLCVQHLQPETLAANVAERNRRVAQSNSDRKFWLLVSKGYGELEPPPPAIDSAADVPFWSPPAWLNTSI